MITDARVLKDDFLPSEVKHRDAEVNQLTRALEPIVQGGEGEDTFLFGPTGVGKTCISRYVVEQLQSEVLDVEYQYVNCWQDYNRFKVLYRILEGVNRTFDIHRKSTPKDELVERLSGYDDAPYIVILDEVDQLDDWDVLYDLYMQSNLTTIMIANREEELFAEMDERVVSRFQSSARISFDRYRVDELVSILGDRAEWGLEPDAVDDDELEMIADAAGGDARVAIGILRNVARQADAENAEEIT
ncbi:MAG: Cdc6/Cdc18 family protein, partial [Halobacteria archaeon]|nr:Cdc6/Cdc18 family protein [Halobacteria archaeon]